MCTARLPSRRAAPDRTAAWRSILTVEACPHHLKLQERSVCGKHVQERQTTIYVTGSRWATPPGMKRFGLLLPLAPFSLSIAGSRQALWRQRGSRLRLPDTRFPSCSQGGSWRTSHCYWNDRSLQMTPKQDSHPYSLSPISYNRSPPPLFAGTTSIKTRVSSRWAQPPFRTPVLPCSAHSSGLTVFPEVPYCRVTLDPFAAADRASPAQTRSRGLAEGQRTGRGSQKRPRSRRAISGGRFLIPHLSHAETRG